MLITELQELSGEIRALDRARQNDFWDDVRRAIRSYLGERNHTYDTLELRPTERLSAIALVKRLFPILKPVDQRAALGFLPAGPDDDIGSPRRSPVRYWSSLSSLAAAPWMAQLHRLDAGAAIRFRRAVRDAEGEAPANSLADQHSQIERLRALGDFGPLDGKLLYDFALRAEIAALDNVRAGQGAWARQERTIKSTALEALQGLKRAAARVGLPEPSPFYAILRMDGDEAGRLLGDPAGPGSDRISTALAFYTAEVQATVDRHQGVLIYAGGNDVLALFSIEQVLEACWALREAYLDSFRRANAGHATTSAGVAFAHMGVPFTQVTEESRRLLDEVAKDGNGRDSMALSITKQSGQKVAWCSTFESLAPDGPAFHRLV
jgi:CRISPR-associated protein Cmr2